MILRNNNFQFDSSKCTNCTNCQIFCSFHNSGIINHSDAFIKIIFDYQTYGNSVIFSDDCINCGLCAKYCRFGALKELEEAEANV